MMRWRETSGVPLSFNVGHWTTDVGRIELLGTLCGTLYVKLPDDGQCFVLSADELIDGLADVVPALDEQRAAARKPDEPARGRRVRVREG